DEGDNRSVLIISSQERKESGAFDTIEEKTQTIIVPVSEATLFGIKQPEQEEKTPALPAEEAIEAPPAAPARSKPAADMSKMEGRFKSGRSPEDALRVIEESPFIQVKLQNVSAFTIKDFHDGYNEVREPLEFAPLPEKRPESQTRRDLNALVDQGILTVDKSRQAHRYSLSSERKDALREPIVAEISRYILKIRDEEEAKGPGAIRKLKPKELQRIWESVNLLHETNIHIFVPQSVLLADEVDQAITAMKRRGVPIEITRYSTRSDRAIQKMLGALEDQSTAGVKKIVLTDSVSAKALNTYLAIDENYKSVAAFTNVRLLNMVIPEEWNSNRQKTVFQAQLLRTAILARILEEGGKHFLAIRAQLSETLEDSFSSEEITTGQFIEQLIKTDTPGAAPEEILNRIQPFLSGRLAISLIEKLEWGLRALKAFYASA
ncbi:MAG: hypothetical protein KJ995_06745, partial [Candidatus Omnitrophica bacterium]|nr:hypothetical protein [Candidatus Omnitrophota bacterium]